MPFQIHALPAQPFAALSALSDADLPARLVQRQLVDKQPGYPCRVSLEDARVGETVYLLHYTHQAAATPFRASHAIYVREGVASAAVPRGIVPHMIRIRIFSLRAFDADGMLVNADLAEDDAVAIRIESLLQHPDTDYLHLHFAKQGCFAARVNRA